MLLSCAHANAAGTHRVCVVLNKHLQFYRLDVCDAGTACTRGPDSVFELPADALSVAVTWVGQTAWAAVVTACGSYCVSEDGEIKRGSAGRDWAPIGAASALEAAFPGSVSRCIHQGFLENGCVVHVQPSGAQVPLLSCSNPICTAALLQLDVAAGSALTVLAVECSGWIIAARGTPPAAEGAEQNPYEWERVHMWRPQPADMPSTLNLAHAVLEAPGQARVLAAVDGVLLLSESLDLVAASAGAGGSGASSSASDLWWNVVRCPEPAAALALLPRSGGSPICLVLGRSGCLHALYPEAPAQPPEPGDGMLYVRWLLGELHIQEQALDKLALDGQCLDAQLAELGRSLQLVAHLRAQAPAPVQAASRVDAGAGLMAWDVRPVLGFGENWGLLSSLGGSNSAARAMWRPQAPSFAVDGGGGGSFLPMFSLDDSDLGPSILLPLCGCVCC